MVVAMEPGAMAHQNDYVESRFREGPNLFHPGYFFDARNMPSALMKFVLEPIVSRLFNRCFPFREAINNRIWCKLTSCRLTFLEATGQTAFAAFQPSERQPRIIEDVQTLRRETAPAFLLSTMLRTFHEKGQFRPEVYGVDNDASRSLVSIIKMARSVKADVVIVVLPVNTFMRANIPPVARRTLFDLLQQSFGTAAPPVIDLVDTLSEDDFYDFVHANRKGTAKLTDKVIEQLSKTL